MERKEGQELAKSFNCAFTEASAKDNENVARIFELMVNEVEKCSCSFFPLHFIWRLLCLFFKCLHAFFFGRGGSTKS